MFVYTALYNTMKTNIRYVNHILQELRNKTLETIATCYGSSSLKHELSLSIAQSCATVEFNHQWFHYWSRPLTDWILVKQVSKHRGRCELTFTVATSVLLPVHRILITIRKGGTWDVDSRGLMLILETGSLLK
jgi:hypothetical protein